MKRIKYRGFDGNGAFVAEWEDVGRYTVRGAMAYLKEKGWKHIKGMGEGHKLRYHWRKEDPRTGASVSAAII